MPAENTFMLRNTLADNLKKGLPMALYCHSGKNPKLGVVYNFNYFDDNLTYLDYETKGPFVIGIDC